MVVCCGANGVQKEGMAMVDKVQQTVVSAREAAKRRVEHTQDSDCTLNEEGQCEGCGVWHDDECIECGGRGFHKATCEILAAAERRGLELETEATQSTAAVLGEVQTPYIVVAHLPACSAVLHVNPELPKHERVTIHCEHSRVYCEGFAAGMVRGSMGRLALREAVQLPAGNPAKSYADRTKIGNTPTCDLCNSQHGSDENCPE